MRSFSVFLFSAIFVFGLLYVSSFIDWIRADKVPSEVTLASSTQVSTISSSTEPIKKAVKKTPPMPGKKTMTTLFWVGEAADADNAYITNTQSYWDEQWQERFGGVDSPNCRNGYLPCSFTPKENPFYFALPYAEYDTHGELKASAKTISWFGKDSHSLLKNRWIKVQYGDNICYAQWEDVGPNGEDDFAYVFGNASPVNTFGERAGLDVSPALWKCLQLSDNDETVWAFVDAGAVPAGPWKETLTTSGISWAD